MDYRISKFGDCSFSRYVFIVRTDKHTDRDVRNVFFKFSSVLKNRRFGFLCRSVVKYNKRVNWRAQLLSQYCTVVTYYRMVSTDNLIS